MAKYLYSLEKGQPKRLEINTRFNFNGAIVKFDGNQIVDIPDGQTLKTGVDIQLPDGSPVHIQLQQNFSSFILLVTRYGVPLPGSNSDPEMKLKNAYGVLYFVGGLSFILGILGVILPVSLLAQAGLGWTTAIEGAIFLVLAYLTQRRSKVALIIGIILYSLDAIITLVSMISAGNSSVVSLFIKIAFVAMMVPGVKAIDELKGKVLPPPVNNDVAH